MMANPLKNEIVDLIKQTQLTTTIHQKNSILLKKLYESTNHELFTKAFKEIIIIILVADSGNAFIEKIMNFIATFCYVLNLDKKCLDKTGEVVEHHFITEIMLHLLEASNVNNDTVRFRSCQLINKILNQMVGAEVSNILCDQLEEYLITRIHDPKSIIRQQAVLALHRLQDPSNSQDVIIQQFIHLMNSDSFAKVRLQCIENIAGRSDVIKHIINRILDVDVNVRLAAYKRLSKFAEFLKISQKRHILHCGFLDTSDKVVDFVRNNLIPKWLEHYKGDILLLMKAIRLDADENDIEKTVSLFEYILETFFKSNRLTELSQVLHLENNKLMPLEGLNWETACYWRAYAQFLNTKEEFEDELENILPELITFCRYVKGYYTNVKMGEATVEFLEKQFILKQFFLIINTYDFADVTNRQCLNALVCNILEKVDLMSDVIETVVKCLENSVPEINSRCRFVSEIISEIMYPMDPEESQRNEKELEFQLSKIMVKLDCLLEEQNKAIAEENFIEADRLKKEIVEANEAYKELKNLKNFPSKEVEKKCDIPTIIRYLDVAASLLLSPQVTQLNSTLKALKDDVIQELLIHDNDNVRAKAFRCYALCCIIDKECASIGIHIFATPIFAYHNGEECDTQILLMCIASAVDLLRIYGPKLMAAPGDDVLSESMDEAHERVFAGGTSLTDLIQGLVDLMDDEQPEIQDKAVWGLCQLILSDRIHSPSLIARLVLKWCNPVSENVDADRLTQIIGLTLEKIPLMTDSAQQLEEAVLLTVKTLANAPKMSPLADVNIDSVANFMVALCKTSPRCLDIQSNLSRTIGWEIRDNPRGKINLALSKILLSLDLPEDKLIIRDLLRICDQVQDVVNERLVLNNITKFVSSLTMKELDLSNLEQESEEKNLANTSRTV